MKITITPNPNHGTLPASDKLGFGNVFTDHMFLAQRPHRPLWPDLHVPGGKRSALRHGGL